MIKPVKGPGHPIEGPDLHDAPVDVRVDDPEQVACLVRARRSVQLQGSLLVAVPVPSEDEFPSQEAGEIIAEATHDADELGLSGKALTPFLLARIAELSGGRSLRANLSLLLNNARVAARIAHSLSVESRSLASGGQELEVDS